MNSTPPEQVSRLFGLLRTAEALRNEKAIFVLFVTGLLASALLLGVRLSSLFFLLALLVFPVGGSIAGLLLMDQAQDREPRPLSQAVFDGTFAALRVFAVSLLAIAAVAVFYLLLGVLLFICKLPFVGAALYAVLFPLLTLLAGLLFFALYAGLAMAGPAIWSGASIREALDILWKIASGRIMELLISLFLLAALICLAEFLLAVIVAVGTQSVLSVSSFIVSDSISFQHITGVLVAGSPDEYTLALTFGTMIGLAMLLAIILAMGLMGANLIYLRITKDLPPFQARNGTQPATRRPEQETSRSGWERKEPGIQSAGEKTPAGVTENIPSAPPVPPVSSGLPAAADPPDILAALLTEAPPQNVKPAGQSAPMPALCPLCLARIQPGDRFCGECGGKIPD
ncbi:MAG: zinc ribbon domain-containing protein [Azoarcus sp.]|jgi:hypothetical protein|nr:zinc ribbon domain-containing protein [Azoarcus sp.]